MYDFFV